MYLETAPDPPSDISVTREESFKTANFSLFLGPWYPGDRKLPDMTFESATAQLTVRMRQNGNLIR